LKPAASLPWNLKPAAPLPWILKPSLLKPESWNLKPNNEHRMIRPIRVIRGRDFNMR
jgi:hypothetical protein